MVGHPRRLRLSQGQQTALRLVVDNKGYLRRLPDGAVGFDRWIIVSHSGSEVQRVSRPVIRELKKKALITAGIDMATLTDKGRRIGRFLLERVESVTTGDYV